jgi:glycosyltransferase involved in cell wall biosynthesis
MVATCATAEIGGEWRTSPKPKANVPRSLHETIAETRASWALSKSITTPARIAPRPAAPGKYRIAFLIYRGNPQCGGQGVYTRHLTRELMNLGHSVEVFSGPPWPVLDEGVGFSAVRGLDLYRDPDPFRIPARSEFTSLADLAEFGVMLSAGFGEPLAYSMRIKKILRGRRGDFDIIHDNQCMGAGILSLHRAGWPLLETLHHPITVDRSIALDHADSAWKRYTIRRWFGFLRMQVRVVQQLPAVLTVSHNSRIDINAQMKVPLERLTVVPVGVDHTVFKPYADVEKKKGRLMVTSSSDVPMKGLVPLLEAIAKLRTERDIDLIVIGNPKVKGRVATAMERLGLGDIVTTISGVSDEELARLYGEAEVAIVPSLYEGFSLPAIEAMSCAVPVVATTGGALPEVVGTSGETGLLVEPNSPDALVEAIRRLLDDGDLRARLGAAGRERVIERFTWEVTARGTAACYDAILGGGPLPASVDFD